MSNPTRLTKADYLRLVKHEDYRHHRQPPQTSIADLIADLSSIQGASLDDTLSLATVITRLKSVSAEASSSRISAIGVY